MDHVHTVSAFIQEPYDESLRLVRRLLVRRGLRLVEEINVTKRLEEELGIGWRHSSTLLVVDDPASLYEALVQDSIAGLHVLHLVAVTGDNASTRIAADIVCQPHRPQEGTMARSIGAHVGTRIADVVRSIAEHYDAIMLVCNAEPAAEPSAVAARTVAEPNELCQAVSG
jgi:hypothetical protein